MRDDQLVGTLRAIFRKVEEDLHSIDIRLLTIETLVTELKEIALKSDSKSVYEITLPSDSGLLTCNATICAPLDDDRQLSLDIDDD